MLHVVTVRVRRRRRRWQLLVVPQLQGGNVGHHEGVAGLRADAKGGQAVQIAGCPRQPYLGPLRSGHRVGVQLGLGKPRRDLHLCCGLRVWQEGWVLNSSWMRFWKMGINIDTFSNKGQFNILFKVNYCELN